MRQRGFTLLELMVVVAIFTLVTGAMFALLNASQQRYRMESEALDAFQTARLAVDEMTRDIHGAGYPATNAFWPAVAAANPQLVAISPFAWDPNYPPTPCVVSVSCNVPNGFDLILEGDTTGAGVQWIRYQLQGTTLMRGVVPKTAGANPAAATSAAGVMVPYLDNVMNNATPAQMNFIRTYYPAMFPGNAPVPIFTFMCDATPAPVDCTAAPAPNNVASNIRQVNITLIVAAAEPDPSTGQPRVATLTARALRINPNQ